jgi:hypothetical protein
VNRDPDERSQPDGTPSDEFDAIVSAGWREEEVPEWPSEANPPPGTARGLFEPSLAPDPPPNPTPDPASAPEPDRASDTAPDTQPLGPPVPDRPLDPTDDEHFVPPEPPPLPRLGPPALVGLGLIGLGLVLLLVPGWIIPEPYGLPLGLVSLASGLGWLVLRLWPDSPSRGGDGDGDDDGAVL